MKINDIVFCGFNRKELRAIRKQTGKSGEEELDMNFTQEVSDVIGADVAVFITPGSAAIIKAGE